MKRIPELRDLSDDHHTGLVLARRCRQAAREGAALDPDGVWFEVRSAFGSDLDPHFDIEERLLLPALGAIGELELAARIRADHAELRAMRDHAEPGRSGLARFGEALEAHIRFEERQVFEATQHRLPREALEAIEGACRAGRCAPVEVRDSAIAGFGVFAVRPIAADEFIREYHLVREVTPSSPVDPDRGEVPEHCTHVRDRVFLVGAPDRHFNHSCDPNAVKRYEGEAIRLYSRRPIAADEEITHDYMINAHGGDRWPCHCGAARCRRESVPSYFDLPLETQLEYLPDLADWFVERHVDRVALLRTKTKESPALG